MLVEKLRNGFARTRAIDIERVKVSDTLADFFGEEPEEKYNELKEAIREEGLKDPLAVWGKEDDDDDTYLLVDGHHRLRACKELGMDIVSVQVQFFESEEEAKEWMFKHQFRRRNMTPEQRDALAVKMMAKEKGKGKGDPLRFARKKDKNVDFEQTGAIPPNGAIGKAAERVAAKLGTTPRTVERAVAVDKKLKAVANIDPHVAEKIRSGEAKISKGDLEFCGAMDIVAYVNDGKPLPTKTPAERSALVDAKRAAEMGVKLDVPDEPPASPKPTRKISFGEKVDGAIKALVAAKEALDVAWGEYAASAEIEHLLDFDAGYWLHTIWDIRNEPIASFDWLAEECEERGLTLPWEGQG
jgi:uncharacterized ParB-like nuclease family protein